MKTKTIIGLFAASGIAAAICVQSANDRAVEVARAFAKFAPEVKTRSDEKNFFVESNGLPDHEMMTGITAWQQQVPLPQKYFGGNAWQFPLFPVPAKEPVSAKTNFFRGAIAIAANGVPIFNPIKTDGHTDTFLAGELDHHGGHSGRGDDYHYHIAPVHLEAEVGKGVPIAFALDGYAIYGYADPDGKVPKDLDQFNGHSTPKLGYHYHATKTYPYLNGGFHGEVIEQEGQVHPQPRATSPREATAPLRGAKITGFKTLEKGKSFSLSYMLDGKTSRVNYQINTDGSVKFDFVDPDGKVTSETYRGRPERRGGGGQGGQRGQGGLGPPPGPRKPWFVDHAKGLDANHDGEVTKAEVTDQCKVAFKEYAAGADSINVAELPDKRTVRNEIGGFMKVHSKELDRNGDGKITETETIETMLRMFDKQDKNGDGKLSGTELEA
jgi:hypothetical protein